MPVVRRCGVSIRRADLGLLEPYKSKGQVGIIIVSIRRADLGLLELYPSGAVWVIAQFQSAGRIWGFWNRRESVL